VPWYKLPRTNGHRMWFECERPDLERVEEKPAPEKPAAKKTDAKGDAKPA
jgi:hypothetical protein